MTFLRLLAVFLFPFFLEAREEIILTIPKSGTHYLKVIIQTITNEKIFPEREGDWNPSYYSRKYPKIKGHPGQIIMGHCEPKILQHISKNQDKLILVRDPRDVVLSAIDFIDSRGVQVWPCLDRVISQSGYEKLSQREKICLILEYNHPERPFSVVSLFDSAMTLCSEGSCRLIRYEDLCPDSSSPSTAFNTVLDVSRFLKKDLNPLQVEQIVQGCFKSSSSPTLNKAKTQRYLAELDSEHLHLLNAKLEKYILFFGYRL